MQSLASLMSFGKSDIANIDDIEEDEDDMNTSMETTAKINNLASKFGLLTEDLDNDEGGSGRNPFDEVPGMCGAHLHGVVVFV